MYHPYNTKALLAVNDAADRRAVMVIREVVAIVTKVMLVSIESGVSVCFDCFAWLSLRISLLFCVVVVTDLSVVGCYGSLCCFLFSHSRRSVVSNLFEKVNFYCYQ